MSDLISICVVANLERTMRGLAWGHPSRLLAVTKEDLEKEPRSCFPRMATPIEIERLAELVDATPLQPWNLPVVTPEQTPHHLAFLLHQLDLYDNWFQEQEILPTRHMIAVDINGKAYIRSSRVVKGRKPMIKAVALTANQIIPDDYPCGAVDYVKALVRVARTHDWLIPQDDDPIIVVKSNKIKELSKEQP